MPVPTEIEYLQDRAHIEPCLGNDPVPMPTGTKKVQGGQIDPHLDEQDVNDGEGMKPKHMALVNDKELLTCNVTDVKCGGIEILVPSTVAEVGGEIITKRRRSALLRRLAPTTRTTYTRGRTKKTKN
ncbi:uncharacterized protein LOC111390363 isoform X2 [Olea europaea var. sylvestris]|uniref:uncharacterized protein LOC111390363 isoform X2 n=1 Tax=Olea europaea var. sylvestris TaxID=158386 RepID=UPI000C1D2AA6|nr:uncharacterized protein LOC111390363 isoform X2 [Olea europaea var. sylvestris]XP_022871168.1 uncharacterized protein LOC111390363 isoform X2 [Olea europaea var. sylvestris]